MTDRPHGPRSPQRRKRVVSSTVAAAATLGVTGLTLTWAVRTSAPTSASFDTGVGAQTARQIAVDRRTISELQASIASTSRALDGGTGSSMSTAPGGATLPPSGAGTPGSGTAGASAPGSPGTTGVAGSGGAVATGGPTATPGGVHAGTGAAAVAVGSTGSVATTSGGTSAPAPAAPAAPPVTSPPPVVTSPPPTVAATTGASPAKP